MKGSPKCWRFWAPWMSVENVTAIHSRVEIFQVGAVSWKISAATVACLQAEVGYQDWEQFQCRHISLNDKLHLCLSSGTTCACSWGTTSCLVVCPAPSSPMLFWAHTLSRLKWETMRWRNMAQTTLAISALPPIRHVNWRRGWWSFTVTTGQRKYGFVNLIEWHWEKLGSWSLRFVGWIWKKWWIIHDIYVVGEWVQQRQRWTF